jgi:endo-1,4-beta-D-glucanase Y
MFLVANIPLKNFGDVAESWFLEPDYHVAEMYSDFSIPFDVGKSFRTSRDVERTGVYNKLEKTFHR